MIKKESKLLFFIKNRKILFILGVTSVIFLCISVFLDVENIFKVNNYWWNIFINIVCSYIVSLIFYIILVYNNEYEEYRKKIILEQQVHKYFLRINTYAQEMIDIIEACIIQNEDKFKDIYDKQYCKIKYFKIEDMAPPFETKSLDSIVRRNAKKVYYNMERVTKYMMYLNIEATNIIVELEDIPIFDYVHSYDMLDKYCTDFDLAIDLFKDELIEILPKIENLKEIGCILN